jgi:hypothetical protein
LLSKHFLPLNRVFLEKLTGTHLVKKFSSFHGIQKYISMSSRTYHCTLHRII